MNLCILYSSHIRLAFRDQKDVNLEFLRKRLAHFYPDWKLNFLEKQADLNLVEQMGEEDLLMELSLFNVILDQALLDKMFDYAQKWERKISVEGAIPGTTPTFVCRAKNYEKPLKVILSNTQREYNTQVNLYRLKRVKVFNSFLERFEDFHTWSVSKLMEYTSSPEGTEFVLSYGSKLALSSYEACPLCGSTDQIDLHADNGHPVMGFLTKKSVYYRYCQNCELVYLNPHLKKKDLHVYYDVYNFETPFRTNSIDELLDNLNQENVSHLSNYEAVGAYLANLPKSSASLDIGGGNGEFCQFLIQQRPDLKVKLLDFRIDEELEVALNKRNIEAIQCDFINEDFGQNKYQLITNWEVIEHIDLEELKNYFGKVYAALQNGGYYIFSTPDFKDMFSRALDFWAMAPGEHLSVFSRAVLEPILTEIGFQLVNEFHEAVTIKAADRWFKYGGEAHASIASQAESTVVNTLLKETDLEDFKEKMRQQKLGSEIILVFKK